jgi:hypothetical protein
LDPSSVDLADLPTDQKAEVVRLVRLVQTDFDPERDPRGWDSVAVLVRGVGYGDEEIRKMGYPQLLAIFRTSAAQMRLQKTGSIAYGIATSTSSIVSLETSGEQQPPADARSKVFRVGASGSGAKVIDVDGPLGRLEEGKGRPKRKLRPEEHLLFLYLRDPKVATLESRLLPAAAEAALGEFFSDRSYRDTVLYREWRAALEDSVRRHGPGWMEGDILEAGLEIYATKPGRSDKRRTLDPKNEAAIRDFLRDAGNAAARARSRAEDGGK